MGIYLLLCHPLTDENFFHCMLEILLAAIITLCISTIIYLSKKLSDKEKRLSESSIENAQLKERINMYENQREQLERAYEERFNIPIRKKSGTKQ